MTNQPRHLVAQCEASNREVAVLRAELAQARAAAAYGMNQHPQPQGT